MADSKISALASGAPAQAGDEYIVARSGANYKLTLTNIAASMPPIGATTPNTGAFTTLSASGAASFADGTSSAPAITNTGDTNTGVYFPAADEVAVAAGGSVAAAFNSNGVFFRNRIINGDMRIDQRNAGAAVSLNGAVSYTLDRWVAACFGGAVTSVQQTTDAPAGFNNSLRVTVTTADASIGAADNYQLVHHIEGFNTADLSFGTAGAATVTLSFWVKSSITGTHSGSLINASDNRSYVFSYSIASANTWEYKKVTISGDTSGTWGTGSGVGISVRFNLGGGSNFQGTAGSWTATDDYAASGSVQLVGTLNATFYITGVQLEAGSVATPFERRSYGQELALCQRYYETGYNAITVGGGTQGTLTDVKQTSAFKVTKRANPTITATATFGTVGSTFTTTDAVQINYTAGVSNNFVANWTASAEL